MTQILSGVRATAPSAGPAESSAIRLSRSTTLLPCTCSSHAGSADNPRLARSAARFSATARGSSPTCVATLKESKGGWLTPRVRSVKAARTPGGAGQSGRMISGLLTALLAGRRFCSRLARSTLLILIERRQQTRHVVRNRDLPFERTPGHGMGQRQPRGMQRLTWKGTEGRGQCGTAARGQPTAADVQRIADDRIADMRNVHAYLMRPASLQLYPHESVGSITLDDTVVGNGLAAIASYCHTSPLRTVAPYGRIHGASARHCAGADRKIDTLNLALGERGNQSCVRFRRARHDEQAAGVLVEAMHQPGPRHQGELRIESEQRVLQRMAGIARPGVHDHACRLVDDEERPILMNHGQWLRLRRHALVGFEPRRDLDLLAAQDFVLGAQPPSIHQN